MEISYYTVNPQDKKKVTEESDWSYESCEVMKKERK